MTPHAPLLMLYPVDLGYGIRDESPWIFNKNHFFMNLTYDKNNRGKAKVSGERNAYGETFRGIQVYISKHTTCKDNLLVKVSKLSFTV